MNNPRHNRRRDRNPDILPQVRLFSRTYCHINVLP
jgi:hypothetical protein